MTIEYTNKRPSILDEKLERFRDENSGKIWLSPDEANTVLRSILYAFYCGIAGTPNIKIEALKSLAEMPDTNDIDFADLLEKTKEERRIKSEKRDELMKKINRIQVITPRDEQDLI